MMKNRNGNDVSKRLREIVGQDRVVADEEVLAGFAEGGLVPCARPLFVVRPEDRGQVERLIHLAKELRLNLVAASSGSPHFKGGTRLGDEGIVVDLSGMKRIVLVDRRNKVAVVEPGVTFGELKAETDRVGLKILMPLMPKRSKSILASYPEREPILIPKYH